jgi:hypothetical protein
VTTKERVAYWAAFFGAFIVALLIYTAHQSETRLQIATEPPPEEKVLYNIHLKSINFDERYIEVELRRGERRDRGEIVVYAVFGYYFSSSSGTTYGGEPRKIVFKPEESGPGSGEYAQFVARTRWRFMTDTHSFPFDDIQMSFAIEADPTFAPGEEIDRAVPAFYSVHSFIPDYALEEGDGSWNAPRTRAVYITLKRDGSVVMLAVFIGAIGLTSAWFLIKKARTEKVELAALAYFGGLWAARGIVLTPLKGQVPFPTYVDLFVIFVFCFTIFGIRISGIIRQRSAAVAPVAR